MSIPERPKFEDSAGQPESISDSLGLRELSDMLVESKANIETVLQVIRDVTNAEPIPDPNDDAACEEFDRKMVILNDLAQRYLGKSEQLRDLQALINEKVEQARR